MWNSHQVAVTGRDLLEDYLPGYLGVVEHRYNLPTHLPLPTSYTAAAQEDTGGPPLGNTRIYAICPGIADDPEETPEGGYNAPYVLMVGIELLSRKNRAEVDSTLAYYQEAIRECVLREATKFYGNVVVDWTDENSDIGDANMALTQGSGVSVFAVYLPNVVDATHSLFPDGPPADPYEPVPTDPVIDQVTEDIWLYPADEELP